MTNDERWMALALQLGRRNLGQTWPNPSVGCVIVKEDRLIGTGSTAPGGRPHAEPQAIAQAGHAAHGATAYVTLEPCAHHGETGPCAEALVKAQIARVVVALRDPDPRVSGGGLQILKDAGIEVIEGVLADQAQRDLMGFLLKITENRPMVTLKLAQTADGRIAMPNGESKWITGPDARHVTHLMRAEHDAILVGSGTVLADDPALDVRIKGLADRSPLPVVVSRKGELSSNVKLAQRAGIMIHSADSQANVPANWTAIGIAEQHDGTLAMAAVLSALADHGITRVFCEGGAELAASLLKENLGDRLALFTAPKLIGGTGLPSIADLELNGLNDAPSFNLVQTRTIGDDLLTIYERQRDA